MSDSIADLLSKRDFEEPPEVRIIKEYVRTHFSVEVSVTIQQQYILIGVTSSALAGALRIHLHELQKLVVSKKRLVIRIV
jgi:hypothetical protein